VFSRTKHDIISHADVRTLVDAFYARVLEDDLLRPVFVEVASLDFEKHMPTMYSFWGSILLGSGTYTGAPFPAHAKLLPHITVEHFDRWLEHFVATVDEHFKGEKAEMAKDRAKSIAFIFRMKMGML
jgi:hemoglobin